MDKIQTIKVIEQYLDGFNSGDFSDAQFSPEMKFISPLKSEPIVGNMTIRAFLSNVAARVESVNIGQHIIHYPLASSSFEFKTTRGDVFKLIDYFEFDSEGIALIWPYFDPKALMANPQRLEQFLTGENY